MKKITVAVSMYAKTSVSLAQLPFQYAAYKVAALRYRNNMQAKMQAREGVLTGAASPLAIAQ